MSTLESFRVLLNQLLSVATGEIFGAAEKTVAEYNERNDRLWRLLRITPEMQLSTIDSKEEVPPQQQNCEQVWSPSLGQEDTEIRRIKEEQEERGTSQEDEQLQGLCDTKDSISRPPYVSSGLKHEDLYQEALASEYQHLSRLKMSKLQTFHLFLNERLTTATVEIFSLVEQTVVEYQKEIDRLRRLLQIAPEIQLYRIDSVLSLAISKVEVLSEEHNCKQEEPEPIQIKEEQEELRTSQQENHHQGLCDTKDSISTPPCVESECEQEEELQSMTLTHVQHCHLDNFCTICGRTLKRKGGLSKHMRIHTAVTPLCCGDCGKTFSTKQSLKMHERIHTGEKSFSCGECGKGFFQKGQLSMHILTHTGEKPFSCDDCGKSFSLKQSLKHHERTHTGEKPFSCVDCGKSFSLRKTLKQHKLTHTGEKPFSCGDCGRSFSAKRNLKAHKLTHTGEKSFNCGNCGKSFRLKLSLKHHERTHTGEKPFICGYCGRSFSLKQSLKHHERTHTGEKPFSCGDCGRTFSMKKTLKQHKLTHTGERPFSCGECGKSFLAKKNLKQHELTHTGEKSFSCDDCGKSFFHKQTLKWHNLTHTGEKSFTCGEC